MRTKKKKANRKQNLACRIWITPKQPSLPASARLLGCGLRRRELAELTLDKIERREDHWAIIDLVGKGGHIRTVPVPDWVKQRIDEWLSTAGIVNSRLFRCVCRAGTVWG